jgi:putative hydrolase of the HAD superfamily
MHRARLLVFDLDDTLYPERLYALSGFRAVGEWLAAERSVAGFAEAAARLFAEGCRGTVFNEALDGLGVASDGPLISTLVDVYRRHAPAIRLHDDAAWALDYFGRSRTLGLLTDGHGVTQRKKVEALGIACRFASIVYTDDFGRDCWKPSPVSYRAVMEATGVEGSACVYVADNPAKDFVTARALGWATVQVLRGDGEYRDVRPAPGYHADHVIPCLYDLGLLLDGETGPCLAR